jgi:sugar transferase (PEP-CTERM/EpsH1 system associated)
VRLKVLWVKSGGLVPLTHGGRIRSYNLARELASRHEVSVFTFYPRLPEDDCHAALKPLFASIVSQTFDMPAAGSLPDYLNYGRNLFSLLPYQVRKYCREEVAHLLRELLVREKYDVIVCDFVVTAGVIPWDLPGAKVVFTHNVEAQIWQRQFQLAKNPLWKLVCWREFHSMRRFERYYLNRADHILAVSELDRDSFAESINPAKISVIPTGVNPEFFRPEPPTKEHADKLVFTGSMDWLPNEDAIIWFYDQILPRIRQELPQTCLWIVGRRPSRRLQALAAAEPALRVTGTVDDVRPYISDAGIYVVPLRSGGGTRLKIFEAMAMGKPVVSTTIGAEGLPVQPNRNIIIADEPEDFARRIIWLAKNPESRHALGEAARRHVERNYSWSAVANCLEAVLLSLLRN